MLTIEDIGLRGRDLGQIFEDRFRSLASGHDLRDRTIAHKFVVVLVEAVLLPVSCLPAGWHIEIGSLHVHVPPNVNIPLDSLKDSPEFLDKGRFIARTVFLPRLFNPGQLLFSGWRGVTILREQLLRNRQDLRT